MTTRRAPRRWWAILLAIATLAPIVFCIGFVYVQQKTVWNDEAKEELKLRTELIRALLQASRESGPADPAPNLGEGGADAPLRRAAARLATLSDLGPGYKALLFEAGRGDPLAVHNIPPEQALPFAEAARAVGPQVKAEQTEIEGAPHLVSVENVWAGGPVLIVARNLAVAPGTASTAKVASTGIVALFFSSASLTVLVWLLLRDLGRPFASREEGPVNDDGDMRASTDDALHEVARAMGAVNKMATALDDAEEARSSERRDRDQLEGRLRRSQVGAAVRQLTDAMAHENGSPLNTILGRARLGAASPDCPPELRAVLETIALQAERIAGIVAEMLRVTRPERLGVGVCDLAAVVEQVLKALGPECERARVPLRLEREADPAYVKVDEERAFQIVVNACMSAVEAQPEGGHVTLRIRVEDRSSGPVRRVLLEVEDQGRTPSEDLDTDEVSGVSNAIDARGFGLMIARGLVVESGGLFELRARAQGGAVCQFTFPGGGGAGALNPEAPTGYAMERAT